MYNYISVLLVCGILLCCLYNSRTLYTLKRNIIHLHTFLNLHRISELPFYFSILFGASSRSSKDTVCHWTPQMYITLDSINCSDEAQHVVSNQCGYLLGTLQALTYTDVKREVLKCKALIATVAQPQTAHLELILWLNLTAQLHQTILAHLLAARCW